MSVHVVRHGRTEANASGLLLGRADPDLDEVGRDQARRLAEALGSPDRVVTSPLGRCRQTAEAFGVPIEVDDRLIELDYGEFDLTPMAEIPAATWDRWRSDNDFRPPNGESHNDLAARVGACLDDLWANDGRGTTTVVVSHVSPIKAAVAWALGVSIEISWRCFVAPASITTIGRGAGANPSLRAFNDTGHLS